MTGLNALRPVFEPVRTNGDAAVDVNATLPELLNVSGPVPLASIWAPPAPTGNSRLVD